MRAKDLPLPRLQLRWTKSTTRPGFNWECPYELVIPLDEWDIRRENRARKGPRWVAIAMKTPTLRESTSVPCTAPDGSRYFDSPYRDGAHAKWDSVHIGNPPIYVIAPDGEAFHEPA